MRGRVTTSFYNRPEWKALRYEVLREQGAKCIACNATRETGAVLHVDHVKPRSVYPELALEKSNLQILCEPCNMGKSNKFADDFRAKDDTPDLSDFDLYSDRMKTRARYSYWYITVLDRYASVLARRRDALRFRAVMCAISGIVDKRPTFEQFNSGPAVQPTQARWFRTGLKSLIDSTVSQMLADETSGA